MTTLREAAQQALEAMEIGYESARVEAAQYHAAMAGYRPERHAALDVDVAKIAAAITALRAALAQPETRNQCGETCERAKLCAVCARGLEEHEPTVRYKCTVVDDRHPNGVPFEQWVNAPQEEPEPVAWQYKKEGGGIFVSDQCPADIEVWNDIEWSKALYTHPPRREWQEQEQEPVLVVEKEPDYMSRGHFYEGSKPFIDPTEVWKLPIGTKLYTAPPRREWQGLKEWEINDGRDQLPTEDLCGWSFRQGVYFAEKSLKEKNNG